MSLGRFVYGSDHEHAGQHDYFVTPLHFPKPQRKRWPWVVAIIVLIALLASAVRLFAADWATVVKPLAKQVPRLEIMDSEGQKGVCSGVVLNAEKGFVLTAAHCVVGKPEEISITVNGRDAAVARSNRLLDLAVVRFSPKDEVSMPLALETPPAGTEVAVAGYAFAIEHMAVQFGRVSQSLNSETKALWINADLIFGDSGGPVIDAQGRLVGLNSAIYSKGPAHMAAAVPVEAVRDFVGQYLPSVSK